MLISSNSAAKLSEKIKNNGTALCKGLFLSARWFVVSQSAAAGTNVIVLPDRESAEYCASDLYSLVDGDIVFFLPDSGKGVERSNYKSSLSVQRTSAVVKLISNKENKEKLFVVTYPEALEEKLPKEAKMSGALVKIKKGESISFDDIRNILTSEGLEKADFV